MKWELEAFPKPVPIFVEIYVTSHYGFGFPESIALYESFWYPVVVVVPFYSVFYSEIDRWCVHPFVDVFASDPISATCKFAVKISSRHTKSPPCKLNGVRD